MVYGTHRLYTAEDFVVFKSGKSQIRSFGLMPRGVEKSILLAGSRYCLKRRISVTCQGNCFWRSATV